MAVRVLAVVSSNKLSYMKDNAMSIPEARTMSRKE